MRSRRIKLLTSFIIRPNGRFACLGKQIKCMKNDYINVELLERFISCGSDVMLYVIPLVFLFVCSFYCPPLFA